MKGPVVAAETYSGPRLLLVLVVFWCFPAVAFGANDITGTVRYLNPDQAAANDAVVLLLQEHGMREVMRTRTNASGAFTFHVQNGTSVYLVRVLHQGVAYEQRASAGSALSIPVFDAAARAALSIAAARLSKSSGSIWL